MKYLAPLVLVALSAFIQFSVVSGTIVDTPIRADAAKYVSYAFNLKNSGTFSHVPSWHNDYANAPVVPDKLTLPGYPAALTFFLDGAPDSQFVKRVTLFQACLGVLSVLLAYAIARRVLPAGWAFAVGLVTAISPHLATISTYVLTEALFTTSLLASTLALLVAIQSKGKRSPYVVAGLLLGITCLVRPQLQPLPFVLAAVALATPSLRRHLPGAMLGLACFLAVMAPWLWRNAMLEQPPGSPSLLVNTLYHGSFPNMMYRDDPRTYGFAYRFDPKSEEVTRDVPTVLAHIASSAAQDPLRYAQWYFIGKPGFFLSWGIIAGGGDIYIYPTPVSPYRDIALFKALKNASFLMHWPLMLLAVFCVFVALRRHFVLGNTTPSSTGAALLALIFAMAIVMHMLGAPYPRYGIPFRPIAYILAFWALHQAWSWQRGRGIPRSNARLGTE
jgi:4-amino-4-deoxy-L-arabinose transferase-like glycosyltransferase